MIVEICGGKVSKFNNKKQKNFKNKKIEFEILYLKQLQVLKLKIKK